MKHPVYYATKLLKESGDTFAMAEAQVFFMKKNGKFKLLTGNENVYEALESVVIPKKAVAILVTTPGWAAPLNQDGEMEGMPSQHPERRRVKLVTCNDGEFAGHAMAFQDSPDEIETDEGTAQGALAEAIRDAWNNNRVGVSPGASPFRHRRHLSKLSSLLHLAS
jgi:hypothetical protein